MAYDRYATHDRLKPLGKHSFVQVRKAANYYTGQLRKIARVIGEIVNGSDPENLANVPTIVEALNRYSQVILPWARITAERVAYEIDKRDKQAWMAQAQLISRGLGEEFGRNTANGDAMRTVMAMQVDLITSLPTEAAQRVHNLAQEGFIKGTRPSEIAADIMRTGSVTRSRADMIARTEVGRMATTATMVRAKSIGITQFEWVTAHDSRVRESHRVLNGKIFEWDNPPLCDAPDIHALPGAVFNCRCYASPVISNNFFDSRRIRG